MYTKEHAELLKPRAGEKWRPANGFEGDMFTHHVCGSCFRGPSRKCSIALATLAYDVAEPEYPAEWQIGSDGLPTCTAWVAWADRNERVAGSDAVQ